MSVTTDSMLCSEDTSNYWGTSTEFYSPEMKISIKRLLVQAYYDISGELSWDV